MFSRRRFRTATKWLAAVSALLLAGAFCLSLVRAVYWTSPSTRYQVGLYSGLLGVGWRPPGWNRAEEKYPAPPGWSMKYPPCISRPRFWTFGGSFKTWEWFNLPLWIPFLPTAVLASCLWLVDRRRKQAVQLDREDRAG